MLGTWSESLEVLSVESHDGDRATAFVRNPTTDPDAPSEVVPVGVRISKWLMGVQHLDRGAVA